MIVDEIDQQRVRNETPTMQDCLNLFAGEFDTPSAAKYVIQLKRFTSLLNKPINEVGRLAFEMELDRIQEERGLSDGTRNSYQAAFSSFFKFLARHKGFKQYQLVNPTKDVPRGKEGKGRMLFLDREQQAALLQACRNSEWGGLYVLVYLLLLTGARRNEIARLRWENVNFSRSHAQRHCH
jgi:integrase